MRINEIEKCVTVDIFFVLLFGNLTQKDNISICQFLWHPLTSHFQLLESVRVLLILLKTLSFIGFVKAKSKLR